MSTSFNLDFEKLAKTDLNMDGNKTQYISPYIRVYATNMVELVDCDYDKKDEFININKKNIDEYCFTNLSEYVSNFKTIKKIK